MLRNWKKILTGAALLAVTPWAMGFSLLGPGGAQGVTAKEWQLPAQNDGWDIGYDRVGDIGAPCNFGEFYRWNTPIITYAFDSSFVTYFGAEGMKAVDAAMRLLNELPHVNKMSDDLSEFPLNSAHLHYEASQLGLLDLKSSTLSIMLEQMGLDDPIRWNYAIRQRVNLPDDFGSYSITRFNFDPVSVTPSSYVNGTLWTYEIFEDIPNQISDAVEVLPAPLNNEEINFPVSAVTRSPINSGYYFTSLTRDDVGGLRFLLRPRNIVAEALLPDVTASGGAFSPYLGTNTLTNAIGGGTGTNGSEGLRGGVGKLKFRKVIAFQAPFKQVSYRYRDQFVTTNGVTLKQSVTRTLVAPDITFAADDTFPAMVTRTGTENWINNETLNGIAPRGGPGVIAPPVVITFNNAPRILGNVTPFFVTEPFITDTNARNAGLLGPLWASFDGTTNAPVIYPIPFGYSLQMLRNLAEGNQP
jgi:hypothetical protein